MIRPIVVLALVVGLAFSARSFLPEGTTITGSGATLAFGFLLLAALQTGQIFHALKLPHLTGFLLCGALAGPEALGLVTPAMVSDVVLIKKVAVGLIALKAGCELNFQKLRPQLRSIGLLTLSALLVTVIFLFTLIFAFADYLPFMQPMTPSQRLVVSLICANVLAALSPAIVMGILSETQAKGPLSDLCLSIVVFADLAIVVTFSFSDSAARAVFPDQAAQGGSIFGALAVHIFGSIAAGLAAGAIFALYIRKVAARVGLFIFAVCFVIAEAGTALHIDPLLAGLSAGLFLENISPISGHEVIHKMEVVTMPVFAVFFAVVGAEIHLRAFVLVAPFAVATALVRAAGLFFGVRIAGRLAGIDKTMARRLPLGMLPQAGIAIGLVNLVATTFPGWGKEAASFLLGTVMVNEMTGPILFRAALVRAGEVGRRSDAGPPQDTKPLHSAPEIEVRITSMSLPDIDEPKSP